ncbi:hypothetical protein ACTHQ1_05110 [Janibacter anophelis]|uniref:hypothetical protein n=1 Tax=Janibacter anophelis TaxID=319054 RepID=UPI003F820C3C
MNTEALAGLLIHRPYCPPDAASLNVYRGKWGDVMLGCSTCKAAMPAPDAVAPDNPPPLVQTASRYVCRAHGTPVAWTGKGCPSCAAERRKPRRRRPTKRKEEPTHE